MGGWGLWGGLWPDGTTPNSPFPRPRGQSSSNTSRKASSESPSSSVHRSPISTSAPPARLFFLEPWPTLVEKLPAPSCSPPFSLAYFPEQQQQDSDPSSMLSLLLPGSPRTSSWLDPIDTHQQFLNLTIPKPSNSHGSSPTSPASSPNCGLCSSTHILLTQYLFHR